MSSTRVLATATASTVSVVLPVFLTGALAVQLIDDLAFSAVALGIAVAAYRGTSAVTAPLLGRLTDVLGAARSLQLAGAVAATSCLGIALLTRSWAMLVAWLVLAGCGNSLGQPAVHRLIVVAGDDRRRGLFLGIKQSSQPTASMLAGLSVPLLAIPFGWRWVFVVGATLALLSVVLVPRPRARPAMRSDAPGRTRQRLGDRHTIVLLAVALGSGNAAAASVPTFYVASAVDSGLSPQLGGSLLAAASVAAVLVRLTTGFVCDRLAHGHLLGCAGLVLVGALGMLSMATGHAAAMTLGVVVALAAGWGYNVLLWFPLLRAYSDAPGAITGAVASGGLVGGMLGPIAFGAIVDAGGYGPAWTFAGVAGVMAAGAMLHGARRLKHVEAERGVVHAASRRERHGR